MRKVNERRTTSDGKSSHCLWQGELKRISHWQKQGKKPIFWIKSSVFIYIHVISFHLPMLTHVVNYCIWEKTS